MIVLLQYYKNDIKLNKLTLVKMDYRLFHASAIIRYMLQKVSSELENNIGCRREHV